LVKPLYELLKSDKKLLIWNEEAKRAFQQLKNKLMDTPALGLPDTTKAFWLFCHDKQGIALGILTQNLGPYRRAVGHTSLNNLMK